jgi:hypothetical protein
MDGVGRLVAHSRLGNIHALGIVGAALHVLCCCSQGSPYSSCVASERHLDTSVTLSLPLSEPEFPKQRLALVRRREETLSQGPFLIPMSFPHFKVRAIRGGAVTPRKAQ